jgi:hypothetical protein
MKKIISILALTAFVFAFSSCSEESYDEKYADPGKASTATLSQLMPGTMIYANDWCCSTYGRYFGYEAQWICKQAQSFGCNPWLSEGIYYNHEGYGDYGAPYNQYPYMVTNFRRMQQIYEALPDAEKPANEAYLLAVETHLYGLMIYLLSCYGPIPFSEIGQVAATGDIAYSSPHFEDDQTLWEMVIDRLGEIASKFTTVEKPGAFSGQDFINNGDFGLWQRYANSLRLRAALRVSTQGALASKGQEVVKQILGNPSAYPIVEDNSQNIDIARQTDGPLNIEGGSGFDWLNERWASTEQIKRMQVAGDGGAWSGKGSHTVLGALNGATTDDPRLPLMYCMATEYGEQPVEDPADEKSGTLSLIPGTSVSLDATGYAVADVFRGTCNSTNPEILEKVLSSQNTYTYYSLVRRFGFFYGNQNWPHQCVFAAEMHFIKAEAIQRGWISGDAKAAFTEGIRQSINFMFNIHNNRSRTEADNSDSSNWNGKQQRTVINPDQSVYNDAWITAFANARWNTKIDGSSYGGGQLEAILDQKWVAFSYLNSGEQWSDLRRTGFPRMQYDKDPQSTAVIPYPMNRQRYVDSERNYNANFQKEAAPHDNYSEVLFWAIADWHDGPKW